MSEVGTCSYSCPDPNEEGRGPAVQQVGPGEYTLDGDLAIHEWADAFDIDLSGRRISTIGGFVTSLLGRIPAVGDEAACRRVAQAVAEFKGRS